MGCAFQSPNYLFGNHLQSRPLAVIDRSAEASASSFLFCGRPSRRWLGALVAGTKI
jgi:hypothetical protein